MMFNKVFAIGGLNWISCANGFAFGQVAGMIDSLQRNEEGLNFNEAQISLIASTFTMTLMIGFGLTAISTDRLGRRWTFIIFSIPTVINWIILYQAKEMFEFIISRIIVGISVGALITLTMFVSSEYTSSQTRAFFLNMITTVAPAIGTSIAHAMGIVFHWRYACLFGVFLNILGIVLPYFWIESPHWLASKGKFEECETAFRNLHGTSPNSERELLHLIKLERNKLTRAREIKCKSSLKKLLLAFKRKYFWGLLILSIVINGYFAATGKVVFSFLAPVMLEEITGTSNVLLFTLLVDGFFVLGSCLSCILIRKTSMRTLLFTTGIIANVILVLFSACYYFKNGESYFNWINIMLLSLYFIVINAGPYPILDAVFSEMYPLELKMYAFFIAGFALISFFSLSISLLPYAVSSIGYHGMFLVYAAVMSICLGFIWLKLPETKGKTLQEIETYFKTKSFNLDQMLSDEQSRMLL